MGLPFAPPLAPQLARLARRLPVGGGYLYEPKWDGFRCLVFRDGSRVELQSRHGRPLTRYFPEVVETIAALPGSFVLDGEIVALGERGVDFASLLRRVHPAVSRVERLRREMPALYIAFDLLALDSEDLRTLPFRERRRRLEVLLKGTDGPVLTPVSADPAVAEEWLARFVGVVEGIDGVVAKPDALLYAEGKRAMVKVKPQRTADCVVAGARLMPGEDPAVASLVLGLYDAGDVLRHVGVASSFTEEQRHELAAAVLPLAVPLSGHPWEGGFGIEGRPMGRLRGAAGVWRPGMTQDWVPVRPERVCEVAFDQLDEDRFRHPATFLRWRPDRDPSSCGFDQLAVAGSRSGLSEILEST